LERRLSKLDGGSFLLVKEKLGIGGIRPVKLPLALGVHQKDFWKPRRKKAII